MSEVVSPRAVTYSGTCHQWFSGGSSARRTLPTIWVHRCTASRVESQPASVRSGQGESAASIAPSCPGTMAAAGSASGLREFAYSCGMVGRLTEVANKVGVSEATVSRVLNGRPGVSEATRQAVLTALDVLGYERPTKLRGERARLVGLVLPELQNPIFPAFADVVGGSLAQEGLTPVLCTHTAGMSEADYIDLLFEQQVSGVLFAGGLYAGRDGAHDHYARLVERKLPDGPGQRRHRGAALPPGVVRRRRGGRAGRAPPGVARAHAGSG